MLMGCRTQLIPGIKQRRHVIGGLIHFIVTELYNLCEVHYELQRLSLSFKNTKSIVDNKRKYLPKNPPSTIKSTSLDCI